MKKKLSEVLKLYRGQIRIRKYLIEKAEETKDGNRLVIKIHCKDQKQPTVIFYHEKQIDLFKKDKELLTGYFPAKKKK